MNLHVRTLADEVHRVEAMTAHNRSLLVEAGAGSGKTAIMAGRVAMILADGFHARNIVAITFTELAASELMARVRSFVERLAAGDIPIELRIALPEGLSPARCANLDVAQREIDEITCSTIGTILCQRLIAPYPAEADIDPGASISDRNEADLVFADLRDAWIREQLADGGSPLLIEMVAVDADLTVKAVECVSDEMRKSRTLMPPPGRPLAQAARDFHGKVAELRACFDKAPCQEADTGKCIEAFEEMVSWTKPALSNEESSTLVPIVSTKGRPEVCTAEGGHRKLQKVTNWIKAGKSVAVSEASSRAIFAGVQRLYDAAGAAWQELVATAAGRMLAALIEEIRPLIQLFRDYKRSAAILDFDDLLYAARGLLRNREEVRAALAGRYRHVLVDEFQDTDPIQAEILWRLCGEQLEGVSVDDWMKRIIRPGSLFAVGDPKQAIFRFRGADVQTYTAARSAIEEQDPTAVLSIATNFRSCASILNFVNCHFDGPLTMPRQPGFTPLDAWHQDRGSQPCVAALDVEVSDDAKADQIRDAEAEAVADLCARLIGGHWVHGHEDDNWRPCKPGDIALLAPTGTDLWRFEEALERRGIPVATQAGKGFFWRQEVLDLIAITRVLADGRDRVALFALLRGPLVGLTEEQLLDIVWTLPRREDGQIAALDLRTDPGEVANPLAKDVLVVLSSLARKANSTSPYDLLSQAVAELRVRPHLVERHGEAERALANVDMYLSMSRSYAVRGLKDFAEAMVKAWEDKEKTGEGRPDAQEESVALFTMHASKGLEWPVVIPVNTSGAPKKDVGPVVDRLSGSLYCKIFAVSPLGHEQAETEEKSEIAREHVRLWYVAATRACETLIIPRLTCGVRSGSWLEMVDLTLSELPVIDTSDMPPELPPLAAGAKNGQTRDLFALEGANIVAATRSLKWHTPSLHEGLEPAVVIAEPDVLGPIIETVQDVDEPAANIQGGRERGLVMHKLFEEILTGETAESETDLIARAAALLCELGRTPSDDPKTGFSPAEIAKSVARALKLPDVHSVRKMLIPECQVYGLEVGATEDTVTYGIADAIAFDGLNPILVVDWKSDVDPDAKTIAQYRFQVGDYLKATGVPEGLIVFATSGRIERVQI